MFIWSVIPSSHMQCRMFHLLWGYTNPGRLFDYPPPSDFLRLCCNSSEMGLEHRDMHTHSNNIFIRASCRLEMVWFRPVSPSLQSFYICLCLLFYPSICSLSPSSWPLFSWSPAEFSRARGRFHQRHFVSKYEGSINSCNKNRSDWREILPYSFFQQSCSKLS